MYLKYLLHVFILFAALFSGYVCAAGGPPMMTDDPGTPGDGHWEINAAALSSHVTGETSYQIPLVDANYGIGDRLQLKFEVPWLIQDDERGEAHRGTGDGLAGVKWRFYDAGENGWQSSTYPQVEFGLPLSNSIYNSSADKGTSYLLPFEFLREFEGYDVNFELGRWFRPVQRESSWIAGCVLTYEVRQGFELMAELHDESSTHLSQDELTVNFGTRWDFSKRYTLLFSAGHDFHNDFAKSNLVMTYVGLQIRY